MTQAFWLTTELSVIKENIFHLITADDQGQVRLSRESVRDPVSVPGFVTTLGTSFPAYYMFYTHLA